MKGRTVLITGGNAGIGKVTAIQLAAMGARVVILARDEKRGAAAVEEIVQRNGGSAEAHLLVGDLASLASVRTAASTFQERFGDLHVLINNAAINVPERRETEDGFELHFAVNYLSHYLLTRLLLEPLRRSAPARIVNVGAMQVGARLDLDDLNFRNDWERNQAVFRAKMAMFLFTRELAGKLENERVTVNVADPGLVKTGYHDTSKTFLKLVIAIIGSSSDKAAATSVYLASSPEVEDLTGGFFYKRKQRAFKGQALDDAVARRLWQESARLVGLPE
jgi:NAD(P)-dependent dehydrogenase (short-subunit alcohol dehydrogenase family)